MDKLHARIELNMSAGHDMYGFWIYRYIGNKTVIRGDFKDQRIEYMQQESSFHVVNSYAFHFSKDELVAIANALIESGFLSEELISNQRELQAMKLHMEDLRKITFNALGVK